MRKRFLLWLLMFLPVVGSHAMTALDMTYIDDEFRVGWGDMMFETAAWHATNQTTGYCYSGHVFAEYQHHFYYWISFGGLVDYEQVSWADILSQKADGTLNTEPGHWFYNVSLVPTVRFTYYHSDYVNLYSALGFGMTINGGSETDLEGHHTLVSPNVNLTLLGVSVGNRYVFGAVEIGGMNALSDKNSIFMLGSRLITASLGVRF